METMKHFERKIGFDRIRAQLSERCTMPTARERLAAEEFSTSAREIEHRLSLADEMRIVLEMEHDFSKEDYPDIQPVLAKLRIEGAFLDVVEVVLLRQALAEIGAVVAFLLDRKERYPALYDRTRGIEPFPEIVRDIDRLVDSFGEMRDSASPELAQIRRAIREREGQAARRLQQVLAAAKSAGIVEGLHWHVISE